MLPLSGVLPHFRHTSRIRNLFRQNLIYNLFHPSGSALERAILRPFRPLFVLPTAPKSEAGQQSPFRLTRETHCFTWMAVGYWFIANSQLITHSYWLIVHSPVTNKKTLPHKRQCFPFSTRLPQLTLRARAPLSCKPTALHWYRGRRWRQRLHGRGSRSPARG